MRCASPSGAARRARERGHPRAVADRFGDRVDVLEVPCGAADGFAPMLCSRRARASCTRTCGQGAPGRGPARFVRLPVGAHGPAAPRPHAPPASRRGSTGGHSIEPILKVGRSPSETWSKSAACSIRDRVSDLVGATQKVGPVGFGITSVIISPSMGETEQQQTARKGRGDGGHLDAESGVSGRSFPRHPEHRFTGGHRGADPTNRRAHRANCLYRGSEAPGSLLRHLIYRPTTRVKQIRTISSGHAARSVAEWRQLR